MRLSASPTPQRNVVTLRPGSTKMSQKKNSEKIYKSLGPLAYKCFDIVEFIHVHLQKFILQL